MLAGRSPGLACIPWSSLQGALETSSLPDSNGRRIPVDLRDSSILRLVWKSAGSKDGTLLPFTE